MSAPRLPSTVAMTRILNELGVHKSTKPYGRRRYWTEGYRIYKHDNCLEVAFLLPPLTTQAADDIAWAAMQSQRHKFMVALVDAGYVVSGKAGTSVYVFLKGK